MKIAIEFFKYTRRFGALRAPPSRSCGGLGGPSGPQGPLGPLGGLWPPLKYNGYVIYEVIVLPRGGINYVVKEIQVITEKIL